MISNEFKRKIIQHQLKKELSKKNTPSEILNTKISSVLVLIDESGEGDRIRSDVSKMLAVSLSKICLIVFKKNRKEDSDLESILSKKDFNLLGKLKSEHFKGICEKPFDLLLNYSGSNLYLNYLTAFSKAKFKVGFTNTEIRLYDFMIHVEEKENTVFNSELKKYLKILNKI